MICIFMYAYLHTYIRTYLLKNNSLSRGDKSRGHERWSTRPCL